MALDTTGISTTLVANTIGVSSNDVGTLCTSSKINKWSKWKPVRYNTLTGITLEQLSFVNYGLDLLSYTNFNNMIDAMRNNLNNWNYLKPRGMATYSEPFRLGDFRNYMHDAVNPISEDVVPNIAYTVYKDIYNVLDCGMLIEPSTTTQLSLSDLNISNSFSNCYFAVALLKQGTTYVGNWLSTATVLGTATTVNVEVPINGLTAGTYQLFYFLIETAKPTITSEVTATWYFPLPLPIQTVTIGNTSYNITMNGTSNGVTVDYSIIIKNNSLVNTKHFTNALLTIVYDDYIAGDALESDEVTIALTYPNGSTTGTITIPPDTSITIEGATTALLDIDTRGGYLRFTSNDGVSFTGDVIYNS